MRIERLEIGGFGRFADVGWELDPGLTVMLGENEAGKTTLLNALRAILFGFESSRDGRTWYPALAGGRRGGRLTLLTGAGERWVVERFGPRGGAGSLTVRAPSGNQGGQETLDRLLHGADRDLFNSIFAFGLGELQDFDSLGGEGVRGRIYGAAAGLGGSSAVDIERHLRQEQEDLFRPSGRLQPINRIFSRMDELHARIADLTRQPEQYEEAHRERADALAAAVAGRESARALRARELRLRRLLEAAPVAAVHDALEAELAASDPALDTLPADAVAVLDRRLASLAAERARLESLDDQLAEIAAQRAGLSIDPAVLEAEDEIRALEADRHAHAASADRMREASAAESRHAAAVAEQLARAGTWDEARLVELDDSIPAVEATREHERAIAQLSDALAAAERQHRSAADELVAREREAMPATEGEIGEPDALEALRRVELTRARAGPVRLPSMLEGRAARGGVAALPLVAGLAAGVMAGDLVSWVPVGLLLSLAAGAALAMLGRSGILVDEAPLLAAAGLRPGATDTDIARRAGEIAEARARRSLVRDQAAALEARRESLARHAETLEMAEAAVRETTGAWASWLRERGLPDGASPEVVRQLLAAAGGARRAAAERDQQRRIVGEIEAIGAALDHRTRLLLARLGAADGGPVDGRLASVIERLERSTADRRTALEAEARRKTLIERRGPIEIAVKELSASVEGHLAALGCLDADQLRGRDAAATERRVIQSRLRESHARLAGIAGSPEAVNALRAELREQDLSAVEAELAATAAEAEAIEVDELRLVARIGELDARIRALESAEELGTLRQELANLEGQAGVLATRWAVRAIAARLLAETRSRYERERQPDVLRAATAHFERITGGRYARIVAPPGDANVRIEAEGGESRVTDELSRGTAEQLYLALRFGLIEEFARHAEPLPVVMDDILVNFDAERAARAAATIRGLAERHQVLYFTCHARTAELLDPDGERTVGLA